MPDAVFITFEGGEGSGKTTQIKRLCAYFREKDLKVAFFREPGSTTISEQIRNILLHHDGLIAPETELFLYCAARAQLVTEKLRNAIYENDVVVCDRYADSTLVYQGIGLGLGIDKIKSIVEYGMCGVVPDMTFFLDVSPQVGLSRICGEKDRIESRELDFHETLRQGYLSLADMFPDRYKVIESMGIDETTAVIRQYIEVANVVKN